MLSTWKRDVASGLIVLLPLLVTVYVVAWLYSQLAKVPVPVEPRILRVVLVIIVFGLLVVGVGQLMRTALGSFVEALIDDLMNRLPGLRVVYNASKMAVETAVSGTDELQTPVKVETWEGMRMTAFKTGKTTDDGREIIFLPTSPNITTGFVIEVDPADITATDESVEVALTRILSAGFGDTTEPGIPIAVYDEEKEQEARADD